MASAAVARLESLLQTRKLDRTVARVWDTTRPFVSSGVGELDVALGGGWRCGEVSEVVGRRSSGRTGVLIATLAAAAARGEVVGLVDGFDRFDPVTASAAGLDLDRVLWVRGPSLMAGHERTPVVYEAVQRSIRALDLLVRAGGFGVVALDLADVPPRALRALPLATWMRLAHANAGRSTVCLLLGDVPMGKSARGASVQTSEYLDIGYRISMIGLSR